MFINYSYRGNNGFTVYQDLISKPVLKDVNNFGMQGRRIHSCITATGHMTFIKIKVVPECYFASLHAVIIFLFIRTVCFLLSFNSDLSNLFSLVI